MTARLNAYGVPTVTVQDVDGWDVVVSDHGTEVMLSITIPGEDTYLIISLTPAVWDQLRAWRIGADAVAVGELDSPFRAAIGEDIAGFILTIWVEGEDTHLSAILGYDQWLALAAFTPIPVAHSASARIVGHGTPKTWRPRCRACGWEGSNTTSRVAAERQANRHNTPAAAR
jgi:hypothetical protein